MYRLIVAGVFAAWCAYVGTSLALTVDNLPADQEWRVKEITLTGNTAFSTAELLGTLRTQTRPDYLFWRERPKFDPIAFETDIERLRRFYEARGYYQTEVTYDLKLDEKNELITPEITISEQAPVTVDSVTITVVNGHKVPEDATLHDLLSLRRGEIFTEDAYQNSEQALRNHFREQAYARVNTQRHAEVDLGQRHVRVRYTVTLGPQATFGETRVEGTKQVSPQLVTREVVYKPGEDFSLAKVRQTREKLLRLGLFRSVQIGPENPESSDAVVPMLIRVEERPPRDIKIGVKYSTQDEIGAQVEWQHRNWLGGGRRLSFVLRYSSINVLFDTTFEQPHFLSPNGRLILNANQVQEDEETFLLNATRFRPRLEYSFSSTLSGFLGYRLEFVKLNNIKPATIRALGGLTRGDLLSGPFLGLTWNTTEDPFDPQGGHVISLQADQAGTIWGGDFKFYKLIAEAKKYQRIAEDTVLAGRLKIGLADDLGDPSQIPLFERIYAGGEKSVRGYGRRRLGPLSSADDPLGGLTLIEGSLEVRRRLWGQFGGALFIDFGQVSLKPGDFPFDNLQFATGVGVTYSTPIGPVRLDIGFPFDPPRGDQPWQVHFSMGQFF
ncbi:MAG: outer membrane protein assembly factor [Candidatus Binatia bacterium]